MIKKIKTYKKLSYDQLSTERFEFKSYLDNLNLSDARKRLKIRAMMVDCVKFNFQSDPTFTSQNWKCSCDEENSPIQPQKHLEICPKYEDLRNEFDLNSDEGLVNYFDAILLRRQEEEDEDVDE